eukprot:COSAG01_NODE_64645_length_275_cov_41.545455_1_plen_59_part_10
MQEPAAGHLARTSETHRLSAEIYSGQKRHTHRIGRSITSFQEGWVFLLQGSQTAEGPSF